MSLSIRREGGGGWVFLACDSLAWDYLAWDSLVWDSLGWDLLKLRSIGFHGSVEIVFIN